MFSTLFAFLFIDILLNPMMLAGLLIGIYMALTHDAATLVLFGKNPCTYAIFFAIALFHACVFAHVYHHNSTRINWVATFFSAFKHFAVLLLGITCATSLFYIFNSDFNHKLDDYLRYRRRH